jgi:hypothetical protein
MKKILFLIPFLLTILFLFNSIKAQTALPDSLILESTQVDVGSTFRTGYFTTFYHNNINSYFKDSNGIEHAVYVDNYKLYYFKSTDNGSSWIKEQIITNHEGDIFSASLVVDGLGTVYIGFTVHDLFNYCNPTGVGSGSEFLYVLYCIHNKTGSWTLEQVGTYEGNAGPRVTGLFVDANYNVHILANRYGWNSLGGEVWEWVRNASSNTWGTRVTVAYFNDAGIDRIIYDNYVILPDQQGNVTLVMCRNLPNPPSRLFYVRHNGTNWAAPVNIADNLAIAWNRYDAIVDPDGHTYIAYLKNNTSGMPELNVMKDFQPVQTVNLNVATNDTLYYFKLHCNTDGLFTMFLYIKNKPYMVLYSNDMINWSDPIPFPDEKKNYVFGTTIRTDTRSGIFTDYYEQINVGIGQRTAQPYGPDTLLYGSLRILGIPSIPFLISPTNAAVVDSNSILLSWTDAFPEVTNYKLEVDTTNQFNTPFIDSTITETNYLYDQIIPNKTYFWRVKAKNARTWGEFGEVNWFYSVLVSVDDNDQLPNAFSLEQNYPNPFNPTTQISFTLPEQSFVELKVFNILGLEVANLVTKELPAGTYTEEFDASSLSSGIYLYKLNTGKFSEVKKMTLIK